MNRAVCQKRFRQLLQTQIEHLVRANDYLAVVENAIYGGRLDSLQQSPGVGSTACSNR